MTPVKVESPPLKHHLSKSTKVSDLKPTKVLKVHSEKLYVGFN